jgi:uncharacterized protein YecE (DUF72 family)
MSPTLPQSSRKLSVVEPSSRRLYVGTSGWAYPSWKPEFYPAEIPAKRFLEHYGTRLNSVEVNYSFRKLPTPEMLAAWVAAMPADFRFSFKAPQRITHFSRLVDCDAAVAEFVASLNPIHAAGKLGPLLFQLPPNFKADLPRLKTFLSAPAFKGRRAPRIAFEFRHESWFAEDTYAILRERDAALCIAESEDLRTPEIQCANTHACYRMRCNGGYSKSQIAAFAKRFSPITEERDVFVYFKHEDEPTGALNAVALRKACSPGAGKR